MYIYKTYEYFVYIITNFNQTVLYTGMTNNLQRRLVEHYHNRGNEKTFAGKYSCYNCIYFEQFNQVWDAIKREKEIKGWRREKKITLIQSKNPTWEVLNAQVCICWPPIENRAGS